MITDSKRIDYLQSQLEILWGQQGAPTATSVGVIVEGKFDSVRDLIDAAINDEPAIPESELPTVQDVQQAYREAGLSADSN